VSAVESILTLDRLRQSVAVKELLQAQGRPLMRKTASVPNFSQVIIINNIVKMKNLDFYLFYRSKNNSLLTSCGEFQALLTKKANFVFFNS
jgi:hypothetical protein